MAWRVRARGNVKQHRVGYDFVRSAIDAHSRLAYSEILADELGVTCAAFWSRALQFFVDHAITVEAVMTDNARNYTTSRAFQHAIAGIEHRRIRSRRPQTNGKVERFNRTLVDEWA